MKKNITIFAIVSAVVIIGIIYFISISSSSSSSSVSNVTISMDELAKHNSAGDCWVVYQNKIYDLSSWLPNHPGGVQVIAQYCGTTGFENAFIQKHGTSKASFFLQVAKLMGDFKQVGNLS